MTSRVIPNKRTLVLNANMTPISIIGWEESFKRIYKDTSCPDCEENYSLNCIRCHGTKVCSSAEVIDYYEDYLLDGRGRKHFIPAVIRNIRQSKQSNRKVPYSRINIFRRDNFTCQYCGAKGGEPGVDLELEHVVPRSRWNGSGSPSCWSNVVTACRKCNRKKDNFFLAHSKDKAEQSDIHIYMPLQKMVNGVMVKYKTPKPPKQGTFHLLLDIQHMKNMPEEWKPFVEYLL